MRSRCHSDWPRDNVRRQCEEIGITEEAEFLLPNYGHLFELQQLGENAHDTSQAAQSEQKFDEFLAWHVTSNKTQITYRNIYCAVCNNESATNNLDSWSQRVKCLNDGDPSHGAGCARVTFAQAPRSLAHAFAQRNGNTGPHFYQSHLVSSCNVAWFKRTLRTGRRMAIDTYKLCAAIYAPVAIQKAQRVVNFKNRYCAICHGYAPTELHCPSNVAHASNVQLNEADYQVTFDTNFERGGLHGLDNATHCPPGHVFDPYKLECRLIYDKAAAAESDVELFAPSERPVVFDDDIGNGLVEEHDNRASIRINGHKNFSSSLIEHSSSSTMHTNGIHLPLLCALLAAWLSSG